MNFEQKVRVIYNGKSEDKVVLSTGLDFAKQFGDVSLSVRLKRKFTKKQKP